MDTWSVAQMMLDACFAVALVGVVIGLLYIREKRIYTRISGLLNDAPQPVATAQAMIVETPQTDYPIVSEPAPTRTRVPRANTTPRPQKAVRRPSVVSASRAEKYLEAVRMYRQGSDKGAIERALGISFMELELLGRIK